MTVVSARVLKRRLADFLFRSGALQKLILARFKKRAAVLMYHRVPKLNGRGPLQAHAGISVSAPIFEKQIKYLKDNFPVLSYPEYQQHIEKRREFRSASFLITFDDGWKDNYDYAYPVLKSCSVPALLFPAVDFIGSSSLFWQDELRHVLLAAYSACKDAEYRNFICSGFREEGIPGLFSPGPNGINEAINAWVGEFKKKHGGNAEGETARLRKRLGVELEQTGERRFLDWNELGEMAENGFAIGSHGCRHAILKGLDGKRAEEEIVRSREILERNLGRKVGSFSYPNGDYDLAAARTVSRAGYSTAFGTAWGGNRCSDNPFMLARINIHEDMTATLPMFLARVAGLW